MYFGKNRIVKWLLILFIVIYLVITFLFFNKGNGVFSWVVIIKTLIISFPVMSLYPIYIIYFSNKSKKKIDIIDFNKEKEYYRYIINEYSPAVLSYIKELEVYDPKDIIATILKLEMKGILKIDSKEGLPISDEIKSISKDVKKVFNYIETCDNIEEYVIGIYSTKTIFGARWALRSVVRNEALKLGLIKLADNNDSLIKKRKLLTWLIFILQLLIPISAIYFYKSFDSIFTFFQSYISSFSIFFITAVPVVQIIKKFPIFGDSIKYIRTEKGNEIYEKILGLENYLKDFSRMDEKTKQEIELWEDYIIYSVIFNQNKKVIKYCYETLLKCGMNNNNYK